jgi:hypothetical protein
MCITKNCIITIYIRSFELFWLFQILQVSTWAVPEIVTISGRRRATSLELFLKLAQMVLLLETMALDPDG